MKQRDRKKHYDCSCKPPTSIRDGSHQMCREGCCTEIVCPTCGGYLGGWGPVGCKCSGYIRWIHHRDMWPALEPEAVKPSLPRGRRHRQKKRKK